jgi:uncharacterized protein
LLVILRLTLGFVFLVIGIIGGFVPVLQGWIFILLALAMFFPSHPRIEALLRKADVKTPRIARAIRKLGVGTGREPAAETIPERDRERYDRRRTR